jgi:hypothetical protein
MCDGDDGSGQAECVSEMAEIDDSIAEPSIHAGPLGVAHVELVDCDHANILRRPVDQLAPQV